MIFFSYYQVFWFINGVGEGAGAKLIKFREFDSGFWMLVAGSPESRIQNPESRIQHPASSTTDTAL